MTLLRPLDIMRQIMAETPPKHTSLCDRIDIALDNRAGMGGYQVSVNNDDDFQTIGEYQYLTPWIDAIFEDLRPLRPDYVVFLPREELRGTNKLAHYSTPIVGVRSVLSQFAWALFDSLAQAPEPVPFGGAFFTFDRHGWSHTGTDEIRCNLLEANLPDPGFILPSNVHETALTLTPWLSGLTRFVIGFEVPESQHEWLRISAQRPTK